MYTWTEEGETIVTADVFGRATVAGMNDIDLPSSLLNFFFACAPNLQYGCF